MLRVRRLLSNHFHRRSSWSKFVYFQYHEHCPKNVDHGIISDVVSATKVWFKPTCRFDGESAWFVGEYGPTMSKALDRLRKKAPVTISFSMPLKIMSVKCASAISVESLGLEPNCRDVRILRADYFLKNFSNCSKYCNWSVAVSIWLVSTFENWHYFSRCPYWWQSTCWGLQRAVKYIHLVRTGAIIMVEPLSNVPGTDFVEACSFVGF